MNTPAARRPHEHGTEWVSLMVLESIVRRIHEAACQARLASGVFTAALQRLVNPPRAPSRKCTDNAHPHWWH